VFGVAGSFLCHGFCTHTLCSTFIFLLHTKPMNKKIKELQVNTQNKNPRQKKLPEATLT
jgi:hypothetical protein